jgi:hypothetical protein
MTFESIAVSQPRPYICFDRSEYQVSPVSRSKVQMPILAPSIASSSRRRDSTSASVALRSLVRSRIEQMKRLLPPSFTSVIVASIG